MPSDSTKPPPPNVRAYTATMPRETRRELVDVRLRYVRWDFEGALSVCEKVLKDDPTDVEARHFAERSRRAIAESAAFAADAANRIPAVARDARAALDELSALDPRVGAVVAAVDGTRSADELANMAATSRTTALRVLFGLGERALLVVTRRR